jgi:glycosyltransferase involved in cell wall biosynthesis
MNQRERYLPNCFLETGRNRLKNLTLIMNPGASSGLGKYIAGALAEAGCDLHSINPLGSRWRKVWPAVKSLRVDRNAMWKARWENMVFSSWAWDRTTRYVGGLLEQNHLLDKPILMVGKEYFPHPDYQQLNYSVFIHHNMKLALEDGVTPWLPPKRDIPAFLERETLLYQHARHVFVGARYVADNLISEYGVKPERIVIAGGGPPPFFEAHLNDEISSTFTHRLIFVGWDFGMKGGKDLLAGFALARARIPNLQLAVVGPDPAGFQPQDGVTFVGRVSSKEDLLKLYRGSDLFVMPSLRDSFGFVFLEAMSQGVPCIGTNLNAMPEIIEHGRTGYVVPPRDPSALANAISRYYDRPENRGEMGRAAQERMVSRYRWSLVANAIISRIH